METNTYFLEEIKEISALSTATAGAYSEILMVNNIPYDLGILDVSGNVEILSKSLNYGLKHELVITKRSFVGKTLKNTNEYKSHMPGVRIRIPENALLANPMYIKELNIVVALASQIDMVKHPYQNMGYTQAAEKAVLDFEDGFDNSILVSITANDPSREIDVLYAVVGDNIVEIPVSHKYDISLYPQLIYVLKEPNKDSVVMTIELDELIASKEKKLSITNSIINFVALDRDTALNCKDDYIIYSTEDLNEKFEKIKGDYDKQILELKELTLSEKTVLDSQIKRLKETIASKDHELEAANAKYNALFGSLNYIDEVNEKNVKLATLDNAKKISDNNVDISHTKSHSAQVESDSKFWQILAVAIVPVIVGVVGYLIKQNKQ